MARICCGWSRGLCHLYACTNLRSGHTDSLGGFGNAEVNPGGRRCRLVDGDSASGMTKTEDGPGGYSLMRLMRPEMRTPCRDFVIGAGTVTSDG